MSMLTTIRSMAYALVVSLFLMILAGPVTAQTDDALQAKAKAYVAEKFQPAIQKMAVLQETIQKANKDRANWKPYSEAWKKWTPEEAQANQDGYNYPEYLWSVRKDKAVRQQCTDNPAAKALKELQGQLGTTVGEIFCTDAKGGNVAQSDVTSDFYQGDEDKFTGANGKKELFADKPKRDPSSGIVGVHVSVPLWATVDGKEQFIGVAIVLVDTTKLP